MSGLTDAEREVLHGHVIDCDSGAVWDEVERIVAARVAAVEQRITEAGTAQDLRDVGNWLVREADQRVKFFPQRQDGVDEVMRAVAAALFRAALARPTDEAGGAS